MTLVYVQNNSGSYSQEGARSREDQLLISGVSDTFSIQLGRQKQLKSGLGANAKAVQWPPFHYFFTFINRVRKQLSVWRCTVSRRL